MTAMTVVRLADHGLRDHARVRAASAVVVHIIAAAAAGHPVVARDNVEVGAATFVDPDHAVAIAPVLPANAIGFAPLPGHGDRVGHARGTLVIVAVSRVAANLHLRG